MTIVIYVLAVIMAIVALVLIAAMFVRKSYSVRRRIVIDKPVDAVFDFVKYVNHAEQYNKWFMLDPDSKRERRGTDGAPGFVYAWDSTVKNVGKGEQEIKSVVDGQRIDCEVRFIKPFEGRADITMTTEPQPGGQTKVTWLFSSAMKYPMNIMLLFMDFEKMLGKDMEESLQNLKSVLEKQ